MRAGFAALPLALAGAALPAFGHGELTWPAQFTNAHGIPCCTGDDINSAGDCIVVAPELGRALGVGSVVTLAFPSGRRTLTINAVHPTQDGRNVVCAPGCLFTEAGV